MNIYYLGPEGSYSHSIAKQYFAENIYKLIPIGSFQEIIKKTLSESNAIGVLPVENSTTSNVHENIHHIFNSSLKIVGEAELLINIHLIGLNGATTEDIKKIYSHPKAIEQASEFLDSHSIEASEVSSTSEGKEKVLSLSDQTIAALGSKELAEDKRLSVINENVGNSSNNKTRFLFVSQNFNLQDDEVEKLTITFKTKHEPGSLATVLTLIAEQGANLTKIESQPIPGTDFEYKFWIDLELNKAEINSLISIIANSTLEYNVVGKYMIGEIYSS